MSTTLGGKVFFTGSEILGTGVGEGWAIAPVSF
jgi:hypothetical protein